MGFPKALEQSILLADIESIQAYCLENQTTLVEELNSPNFYGETILHIVAKRDVNGEIMKTLIHAGGENLNLNHQDDAGRTPVHCAALTGKLAALRVLVENGANIFILTTEEKSVLDYAMSQVAIDTLGIEKQQEVTYFLLDKFAGLFDNLGALRFKLDFTGKVIIGVPAVLTETLKGVDKAITLDNYKKHAKQNAVLCSGLLRAARLKKIELEKLPSSNREAQIALESISKLIRQLELLEKKHHPSKSGGFSSLFKFAKKSSAAEAASSAAAASLTSGPNTPTR